LALQKAAASTAGEGTGECACAWTTKKYPSLKELDYNAPTSQIKWLFIMFITNVLGTLIGAQAKCKKPLIENQIFGVLFIGTHTVLHFAQANDPRDWCALVPIRLSDKK
jgi:hypothetical protein